MIADYALDFDAAQFAENILPGASRDNDTGVLRRQASEQHPGLLAHPGEVRMFHDGRQRSIEIEGAQGPLLSQ
jgi:hypothetical protein